MAPSETTSTEACKLCKVCINQFSQEARWLTVRNKMCTDEKRLRLVLSDYSLKGRESSPI